MELVASNGKDCLTTWQLYVYIIHSMNMITGFNRREGVVTFGVVKVHECNRRVLMKKPVCKDKGDLIMSDDVHKKGSEPCMDDACMHEHMIR